MKPEEQARKDKEFNMKKVLLFVLVLLFCSICNFSQNDGEDMVIGNTEKGRRQCPC
jgi:hypothetical protein